MSRLYDIAHNGRIYCGPAALIAVTGYDLPTVRAAINRAKGVPDNQGIIGTSCKHLGMALESFGFDFDHIPVREKPTLEKFALSPFQAGELIIAHVTNHYVTILNGIAIDNHIRFGCDVTEHPSRRKHVRTMFLINGRAA